MVYIPSWSGDDCDDDDELENVLECQDQPCQQDPSASSWCQDAWSSLLLCCHLHLHSSWHYLHQWKPRHHSYYISCLYFKLLQNICTWYVLKISKTWSTVIKPVSFGSLSLKCNQIKEILWVCRCQWSWYYQLTSNISLSFAFLLCSLFCLMTRNAILIQFLCLILWIVWGWQIYL